MKLTRKALFEKSFKFKFLAILGVCIPMISCASSEEHSEEKKHETEKIAHYGDLLSKERLHPSTKTSKEPTPEESEKTTGSIPKEKQISKGPAPEESEKTTGAAPKEKQVSTTPVPEDGSDHPDDEPEDMYAQDPLEEFNRVMFKFNEALDTLVLKPVSRIYIFFLPEPIRDCVRRVLDNLSSPIIFMNDVLQGNPQRASETFARFAINSTLGFAGIFDAAAEITEIEFHSEDFGQTLATYGVTSGPYLMLPVLGPSNPRDLVGIIVDFLVDPVNYFLRMEHRRNLIYVRTGLDLIDRRSRSDEIEKTIYNTDDPYNMLKILYLQNREFNINNGQSVGRISPRPDDDE
jgi:phospholipid-binding lipoprotein MlaA